MHPIVRSSLVAYFLLLLVPAVAFCDAPRTVISEPPDPLANETVATPMPTPAPITPKYFPQFGFGVKGGFLISMQNTAVDGFEPVTYLSSPTAGVFVDTHLTELIGFQLEANYLQKGSSGRDPKGAFTGQGTYTYVEFPLLLRFQGDVGHNILLYFLAGSSILFPLNQTDVYTYPTTTLTTNHSTGTDYDYCVGVGMEIKNVIIELRVGGDLIPSQETFSDGVISYSNFSQFEVGYRFF